jgi:hypothetical protein
MAFSFALPASFLLKAVFMDSSSIFKRRKFCLSELSVVVDENFKILDYKICAALLIVK